MAKRRKFQRPPGTLPYRKLYILAVEGTKTEPQYFSIFKGEGYSVTIKCLKGKGSSPLQVLKRMKEHIKGERLRANDEAWLIIDRDQWSEEDIDRLYSWTKESKNYGLALSNPLFEYWLLLHFEDGHSLASAQDCITRLERHLSNYDKRIEVGKFSNDIIKAAVLRAEQRDDPPCKDWPKKFGSTTVYRLVKKFLEI
jgi:hypothetical protein